MMTTYKAAIYGIMIIILEVLIKLLNLVYFCFYCLARTIRQITETNSFSGMMMSLMVESLIA